MIKYYRQIKCLSQLLILIIGFGVTANAHAAVQTVKTGIASPQTSSEIENIELLRARAIRNAMDLALLEVNGTLVSSQQADTIRTSDKVSSHGEEESQDYEQESRYRDASLTRTEGHVRVIEILKEWQEGDQYHVKVKLEVLDQPEASAKHGAGYFWERIGKPGISLVLRETVNSQDSRGTDAETLRFMRDILARNGLQTALNSIAGSRYQIQMTQEISVSSVKTFGTYAAHCNLSYRIVDDQVSRTLLEERSSHGPQAGFSLESVKRECLKAIAPALSEKLVRSLAQIFNDQWNQGDEYIVHIAGIPGAYLAESVDAIQQSFRVEEGHMDKYVDGVLAVTVRYQGKNSELTSAVISAFDDIGQQVIPERAESNVIEFRWLKSLKK